MAEEQLKSLSPVIDQIVLRNLGLYCSERLSVDIYYMMEAINLMIPDIGEEYIKEKYKERGKDWDKIKQDLQYLNKLINRTKLFYDPIADKKFEKKDQNVNKVQAMFKRYFMKTGSKVALMQPELYDVFVFLTKISTLQRRSIPNDAFKVLEHQGKGKIDLFSRKTRTEHPTPEGATP